MRIYTSVYSSFLDIPPYYMGFIVIIKQYLCIYSIALFFQCFVSVFVKKCIFIIAFFHKFTAGWFYKLALLDFELIFEVKMQEREGV